MFVPRRIYIFFKISSQQFVNRSPISANWKPWTKFCLYSVCLRLGPITQLINRVCGAPNKCGNSPFGRRRDSSCSAPHLQPKVSHSTSAVVQWVSFSWFVVCVRFEYYALLVHVSFVHFTPIDLFQVQCRAKRQFLCRQTTKTSLGQYLRQVRR